MQQRVIYGDITIVVTRATGRTDLKASVINRKAAQDAQQGTWGVWQPFADACAHVAQAEGLPFDPTALMDAEPDVVRAAYEAYLDLDKGLLDLWKAAIKIVDAPIDRIVGPEPLPRDADPNSSSGAQRARKQSG